MLTSLLSLYITYALSPELGTNINVPDPPAKALIQTANFDINNLSNLSNIPLKDPYLISPIISARALVAIDMNTGATLYEKNAYARLAIASITKLMTVLIILEENDLEETVTVSANAATTTGSTMFLRTGEEISIRNLIYGALINSANDAAVALAEHNAGTTNAFVEKMNKKAVSLGLINSHFSNPIGLDNSENYSSAADVAKLAKYIYQKKFVQQVAQVKKLSVTSVDGKLNHDLTSTNELLDSYLHVKGLKTGSTDMAGLCLVTVAENDQGNEIITVMLNSPARFTESKILIDWVFRAYSW